MTRRTAGSSPARVSNHFEPSPDAVPLDALLSTAEVAALLHVSPRTLRNVYWRETYKCLIGPVKRGGVHSWPRTDVERLLAHREGM